MSFSPDKSFLASAGADGAVFIIDMDVEAPVICLQLEHPNQVHCLIWPAAEHLIIGRSDGAVQFLEFDGKLVS